jgi:hypothetical protein
MTSTAQAITFPVRYVDRTQDQRVCRDLELVPGETALLLRHTSNIAYPGSLELSPESVHWPLLSRLEHGGRMRSVIDNHIVPLAAAARAAGVHILYVIDGWAACERYPQWRALSARVPEEADHNLSVDSPDAGWREPFESRVFMPGYRQAAARMNEDLDIAPPLAPGPMDWIATTDRQVRTLLNENGVWNVLHAGFDMNDDVMYSAAAGLYWFGRSYRSILLRDCVAGEEPAAMADGERLKNTIVDFMEMCGYSAEGAEIRAALSPDS